MAFNFFNYDKEGPGVSKNEPQKIGVIRFFEYFFKNFWKLCISSIWYWLLSIPVITSGLAAAGITNVTRNMAVDTHSFGTSDFFSTIKKNWKQALPVGIINALIMALLVYDVYAFTKSEGTFSVFGIAVSATSFLFFCAMRYYIWVILITFKFKISQIYKNAFKLAFAGIKNNLLVFLGLAFIYAICYGLGVIPTGITQFLFILVVLFILPGYRFLVINFGVFPVVRKYMIDPYYAEHPDDDIELRRRLGLIKEEYSEEDLL